MTTAEERMLRAIAVYSEREGFPPSMQDIADEAGYKTRTWAFDVLARLVEQGFITRKLGQARSVLITEKGQEVLGEWR